MKSKFLSVKKNSYQLVWLDGHAAGQAGNLFSDLYATGALGWGSGDPAIDWGCPDNKWDLK